MTISRKRIVELLQQSIVAAQGADVAAKGADWIVRFMDALHKEDPDLAYAIRDKARAMRADDRGVSD